MTPFYRSLQCVFVQTSGVYTASWLPCGRTFAFAIPHRQTEYRRVVSECLQSGFSCRCSHANVTVLTIRLSTTVCYARPLYTFRAKHRYIFGIGLLIYFIICYSFFSSKHFFQQLLTDSRSFCSLHEKLCYAYAGFLSAPPWMKWETKQQIVGPILGNAVTVCDRTPKREGL